MQREEIRQRIIESCDQNRNALLASLDLLAKQAAAPECYEETNAIRRSLNRIKAKEFCSPDEGGLLLGCSGQHLRNQVQKAIDGAVVEPIPLCDLGGPVVFPVGELLAWAAKPKPRAKKHAAKNKTRLRAVSG